MNSTLGEVLIVLALICGAGWYLHHAGYEEGKAESSADLGKADSANNSCVAALAQLKMSVATCESDRLVDQVAQDTALAYRDKQQASSKSAYDAAVAKLKQRMQSNECIDWAKQPACGSVQ